MRVTYVNVRARHLLKKSMVRAPKNMAAIVIAIVMNLPGMTLQPLYTMDYLEIYVFEPLVRIRSRIARVN